MCYNYDYNLIFSDMLVATFNIQTRYGLHFGFIDPAL